MIFSESLKKNQDFQRVYRAADSKANRYLVLYRLENGLSKNRIGISVSKKVGNSVVRHHMCRLIRESYRLNEKSIKPGYDLVVVVRPLAKGRSYAGDRERTPASHEASGSVPGAFVGESR